MEISVLDFIDSNTLRQHLSGKSLEPAIECILIAQCKNRTLKDKLEALQLMEFYGLDQKSVSVSAVVQRRAKILVMLVK